MTNKDKRYSINVKSIMWSFLAGVFFASLLFVPIILSGNSKTLINRKDFGDVSIVPADAEDLLMKDSKRLTIFQNGNLILFLDFVEGKRLRDVHIFQNENDIVFSAYRSSCQNEWKSFSFGGIDRVQYFDKNADGILDYTTYRDMFYIFSGNEWLKTSLPSDGKVQTEDGICYRFLSDKGWIKEDCNNTPNH